MEDKDHIPKVEIEIKRAEDLKESVRKEQNLPPTGPIIKRVVSHSPLEFQYIPIETGGFLGYLNKAIDRTNSSSFIAKARKLC